MLQNSFVRVHDSSGRRREVRERQVLYFLESVKLKETKISVVGNMNITFERLKIFE